MRTLCTYVLLLACAAVSFAGPTRKQVAPSPADESRDTIIFPGGCVPASWKAFFGKLDAVLAYGDTDLKILHMGGSHVQGGMFTGRLREDLLSMRSGIDGSFGLVFPFSASRTNTPTFYTSRASGKWASAKNTDREPSRRLGLTGMAITAESLDAKVTLRAVPREMPAFSSGFDQVQVCGYPVGYARDSASKCPSVILPGGKKLGPESVPEDSLYKFYLPALTDTVSMLLAKGAKPQNIAILVRTNSTIPLVADYFSEHMPQIRIVSDEAFRLDASVSVCLLVQALHVLTHPDDQLAKATIAKLYQRTVLGNSVAESELFIKDRPIDALLPPDFTQQTAALLHLPLYELTERLFHIFQLDRLKEQSAYVCAFYDQLNKFTLDNSTDIDAFIREWEETICSKTIQNTATDGIRILSIHKSKGLEFDHVLIPFCDWRLEHSDMLWCQPKESPFDALPIVPVDYIGKQMMGTIYETNYLDEHLQNTVDNLNLLYVAFTRASKNLFVLGRRNSKGTRSALIESVLSNLKLDDSTLEGMADNESPIDFTYGDLYVESEKPKHTKTANVFLQPVTLQSVAIESFNVKTEFRQSNKSREFIEGDDEQQELSYIKIGSVLHNVFSTIRTSADIERALAQLQHDGVLYDDEVTAEKVTSMLRRRLESPRIRDWFSDHWQLFNECSILTLDAQGNMLERRPDRVMTDGNETHVVDFKFGRPQAEYHEQVREYMQLLRSMGMPNVKGWLWYVYINKVEEVI